MDQYPKDLEEVILYCAGYLASPLVLAAGGYAAGAVIAGYRTLRDVMAHKNYRVEVRGHRGNKTEIRRHLGAYEIYKEHLNKDLGLDRKNEI
jgi:hypothetical protein